MVSDGCISSGTCACAPPRAALRTARARRQALRALEMDSRTAQAQYEANPADAASLLAWRQAHHLLQQLNAAASHSAAVQAGVVWQHYGEQSTFWFYHLARERQAQTTITQLHTPRASAAQSRWTASRAHSRQLRLCRHTTAPARLRASLHHPRHLSTPRTAPCSSRPPSLTSTAAAGRGRSWRRQHLSRGPHSGPQLPAAGQGTRL